MNLAGGSKAVSAQGQGCPSSGATLVQGVYIHVYVILDVEVGSYQLPINCQSLNYQLMIRDEFNGVVLQSGVALTAVGLAMVQ